MTPQRWEEVSARFEEALVNRESLATCDAHIQSEVRRLLDLHDRAADFLAEAPSLPADILEEGSSPENLHAGRLLVGRYLLSHEIGRGGAGLVYFAKDQTLHERPVVVKILHSHWLSSAWMRVRFRQECEALARLNHPGIVRILDLAETESRELFLVMEHYEGDVLRSQIEEPGMDRHRVGTLLVQLAEALETAHAQGILHRDLKPENVFLARQADGSERAVLLDFGIAKMESPDDTRASTIIAGTTQYMAPEQLLGRSSRSSDVFALAVMAHEMLTGQRPYGHLDWTAKPELKGFSDPVRRVLLAGLHPNEAARTSTPTGFARSLRDALEDTNPSRRTLLLRSAAAALGTAGTGGAVWIWRDSQPLASQERLIEYSGSVGPPNAGFERNGKVEWYSEMNPSRSGYDRIRVESVDQGQYYRRLSNRQKRAAMKNGWKLTAECRPVLGLLPCVVDLSGYGNRFDMCLLQNGDDGCLVALISRLAPEFAFERVQLTPAPGAFFLCEMTYDPARKSAALSVDGVPRYDRYQGHSQFQEGFGLVFGAGLYRTPKAVGQIRKIRFEIFS